MPTRVTYIISNINKSAGFEWTAELIDQTKFQLNYILLNPESSLLEDHLLSLGIPVKRITYKGKRDLPKALLLTILKLIKHRPRMVHAHLFDASIIGLLSAWLLRIKVRIYTRHHSSLHHQYHPHAVKYDKLCNRLSTHIVAVSGAVKNILIEKEQVSDKKISVIHHGLDLREFNKNNPLQVQEILGKYQLSNAKPIIGVISRWTEWKGLQFIIPAFTELLKKYPNAVLVLANAKGDYTTQIRELLKHVPDSNYRVIEFEENILALYQTFNVFVHVPIDSHSEAFGQIYIEAMAAGIPSVFTLSGIANDIVKHKRNALVAEYRDHISIQQAIETILEDPTLAATLVANAKQTVADSFTVEKMIRETENLYTRCA